MYWLIKVMCKTAGSCRENLNFVGSKLLEIKNVYLQYKFIPCRTSSHEIIVYKSKIFGRGISYFSPKRVKFASTSNFLVFYSLPLLFYIVSGLKLLPNRISILSSLAIFCQVDGHAMCFRLVIKWALFERIQYFQITVINLEVLLVSTKKQTIFVYICHFGDEVRSIQRWLFFRYSKWLTDVLVAKF